MSRSRRVNPARVPAARHPEGTAANGRRGPLRDGAQRRSAFGCGNGGKGRDLLLHFFAFALGAAGLALGMIADGHDHGKDFFAFFAVEVIGRHGVSSFRTIGWTDDPGRKWAARNRSLDSRYGWD